MEIRKDNSSLNQTQWKQTEDVFPSRALIDLRFLLNYKALVIGTTQRPQKEKNQKKSFTRTSPQNSKIVQTGKNTAVPCLMIPNAASWG